MAKNPFAAINKALNAPNKEAARATPLPTGGQDTKLPTYRTEIYSFFTTNTGETNLLYSADNWVRLKLELETAGPVSIGHRPNLAPLLGGAGRLLPTGKEREFYLTRGTRIYVLSQSVNRISVTVEPVPWLEQIAGMLATGFSAMQGALGSVSSLAARFTGQPLGANLPTPSNIPAALANRVLGRKG